MSYGGGSYGGSYGGSRGGGSYSGSGGYSNGYDFDRSFGGYNVFPTVFLNGYRSLGCSTLKTHDPFEFSVMSI